MGSKILIHFSKDTLTNFPLIINGYRATAAAEKASADVVTASNLMKSVETNSGPLEEVSSSAS